MGLLKTHKQSDGVPKTHSTNRRTLEGSETELLTANFCHGHWNPRRTIMRHTAPAFASVFCAKVLGKTSIGMKKGPAGPLLVGNQRPAQ
jgi:hypothetical protein